MAYQPGQPNLLNTAYVAEMQLVHGIPQPTPTNRTVEQSALTSGFYNAQQRPVAPAAIAPQVFSSATNTQDPLSALESIVHFIDHPPQNEVAPPRSCAVCGRQPTSMAHGVPLCKSCTDFYNNHRKRRVEHENREIVEHSVACLCGSQDVLKCRLCRWNTILNLGLTPEWSARKSLSRSSNKSSTSDPPDSRSTSQGTTSSSATSSSATNQETPKPVLCQACVTPARSKIHDIPFCASCQSFYRYHRDNNLSTRKTRDHSDDCYLGTDKSYRCPLCRWNCMMFLGLPEKKVAPNP